ncbi:MAG: UDP-N-acetylmuramate--alanine ligase [Planctomycetes bacterium]|nr:UDP-N-acetylmuramate--alanine ligase [Planctomycetota bacterium]
MSALAQLLQAWGYEVSGSDRARDQGRDAWLYRKLEAQGVRLIPQAEDPWDARIECVVVSSAIEDSNPEVREAKRRALQVVKRSELLASCMLARRSVAVSGTGGKSTTAALIAQIGAEGALDPTVVLGAFARRYESPEALGNVRLGGGEWLVAEVDESDGSVRDFRPEIAVLTNVSKDHFDLPALADFFRPFLGGARQIVLSAECPVSAKLATELGDRVVKFGRGGHVEARNVEMNRTGSSFEVAGLRFCLPMPGRHNLLNALAALAAARCLGVPDRASREALAEFGGLRRRWTLVGSPRGIDVVDDFAHSPLKITSALATAHLSPGRVHAVFQPHGYGPTRFLWKEYLQTFEQNILPGDWLYLLEIYDAGGTADRSISSRDLAKGMEGMAVHVMQPHDRTELIESLKRRAVPGDLVLVMGARDHSLSELAEDIVRSLAGLPVSEPVQR